MAGNARRYPRSVAARDPSVAPRGNSLTRLRLLLWTAVLLLAVIAVALFLALRSSRETAQPAPPQSAGPAATWAAGERPAPAFDLLDEQGSPLSLTSLRGRPVIVTFIDPLCRDYCPIEAQRLNDVASAFPQGSKPAVVAVSVNVYGNARANLRQDERKWKLGPQWRWAVGAPASLGRVWADYHVQVLADSKTVAGVTVHRIAHTEAAYVIDANGDERALFLWPYRARDVVRTLRALTPS
jgi:cytochrome oxidase Cu insertion factor (SCO1/SenC/PrrC family)